MTDDTDVARQHDLSIHVTQFLQKLLQLNTDES